MAYLGSGFGSPWELGTRLHWVRPCWSWATSHQSGEVNPKFWSIIFQSFNHANVLESGFIEAAPDFLVYLMM